MPRATRAGLAWASAAPILVLVACGGRAIHPLPSVENDAASADAGDRSVIPPIVPSGDWLGDYVARGSIVGAALDVAFGTLR